MKGEAVKAWAAKCVKPTGKTPFLHNGAVRALAQDVRIVIGHSWDMDWRAGWRRAYRRGWRVVRVRVEEIG